MTPELRPRAAYLHIAKCAGTSVTGALTAAAGHPVQPDARLDSCYTFGPVDRSTQSEAAQRMILDEANIDPGRPPGSHVFETHWSLPTLRTWFVPDEIATVLREPTMRLLSFVLFAHTRTQAQRRTWYPDDVGARMVRRPFPELLRWEPAARANDNLSVRQLLWGDPRIVGDGFVLADDVDELAADANAALDAFGFVGVIEAPAHAIDGLGRWLGRPLEVGHANRTVEVPYTGLITPSTDLDEVHQLLLDRTAADRIVWAKQARRFGIDPGDVSFERAVGERLRRLSTSSSFALWSDFSTEVDHVRPTVDARVPSTRVLVVGDDTSAVRRIREALGDDTDSTLVRDVGHDARDYPVSDTAAGVFDRAVSVESVESVDLRALLAGRDFDVAIVVPHLRVDLAATARQLADAVIPGGSFTLAEEGGDAGEEGRGAHRTRRGIDPQFWTPTTAGTWIRTAVIAPIEPVEDIAASPTAATMDAMDPAGSSDAAAEPVDHWSRYGEEILLDNPTDSRAIVLGLLDGEPKRILELGCSAGLMTRVMHARGHRVTGIEIDPVAAEICRPFTDEVLVGDLDVAGAADLLGLVEPAGFDVLLAADVLEHLRNPLDALQRATAVLKPDGTAILSIPNVAHGDVRLALLSGRFDYRSNGLLDRTHVQLFTLTSLTAMIRDAGLVPVSWLRSTRPVGTTEIEVDEALFEFGRRAFADDPEVDTYQWIVTCRRADDPSAVADWPEPAQSSVAGNVAPMLDITVPQPRQPEASHQQATEGGRRGPAGVARTMRRLVARARRVAGRAVRAVTG